MKFCIITRELVIVLQEVYLSSWWNSEFLKKMYTLLLKARGLRDIIFLQKYCLTRGTSKYLSRHQIYFQNILFCKLLSYIVSQFYSYWLSLHTIQPKKTRRNIRRTIDRETCKISKILLMRIIITVFQSVTIMCHFSRNSLLAENK